MRAVILAAGLGTRLRPLTDNTPKVMIDIGGQPVLEHLVRLCRKHGILDIILTLGYLPRVIRNYFGNGEKFGVNIKYTLEKEMLGGAGVLRLANRYLFSEPFFVLNGDVLTDVDLGKMLNFHKSKGGLATYLVHRTDHPYDSDVVEFDNSFRIFRFFRPKPDDLFTPLTKTGTHLFEPEVLNYIPESAYFSLEKDLTPRLLSENKNIYAFVSDAYSKDMGTPERLEKVRKDYKEGKIVI